MNRINILRQVFLGFISFIAFLTAVPVQAADGLTGNDRKRYDYFFQEAARLQALGRYGDAFELFEHARKINPRAAEVYFYQSMYYQQMKQDSLEIGRAHV